MIYYTCAPHCRYWYNHTSWSIPKDLWVTYFQSRTTVDSGKNDTSSWKLAALHGFTIFRIYALYHWVYLTFFFISVIFFYCYIVGHAYGISSHKNHDMTQFGLQSFLICMPTWFPNEKLCFCLMAFLGRVKVSLLLRVWPVEIP